MLDTKLSDTAGEPAKGGAPDGVQILCGDWWEDGWASPYIRARFPAGMPQARLVVRAFNPAAAAQKNSLIVRLGNSLFWRSERMPPESVIELDQPLPEPHLSGEFCDISLRAERDWRPSGGDDRCLGFVLIDWRLET